MIASSFGLRRRLAARRETIGFLPFVAMVAGYGAAGAAVAAAVDEDIRDWIGKTLDEARIIVGTVVAAAAPIVGVIPGIGQGIAAVLAGAAAIALGKPLDEALIDAVANAVPGGGLVKAAVYQGATAGKSLIEGDSFEEAMLDQARQAAKTSAGEIGGVAFDAAVALARGEDLQRFGFRAVAHWFPGGDLAGKAARFMARIAEGAARGESIERIMVREVRGGLALIPGDVQKAIDGATAKLLAEPARLAGGIEAFARDHGLSLEVAQAAFMSVSTTVDGVAYLNHHVRNLLRTRVAELGMPIAGEARIVEAYRAAMAKKIPLRAMVIAGEAKGPVYKEKLLSVAQRDAAVRAAVVQQVAAPTYARKLLSKAQAAALPAPPASPLPFERGAEAGPLEPAKPAWRTDLLALAALGGLLIVAGVVATRKKGAR